MFLNKNFDRNERNDISWQILGSFMEHFKPRELTNYLIYCLLSRNTKKTLGNNFWDLKQPSLKKKSPYSGSFKNIARSLCQPQRMGIQKEMVLCFSQESRDRHHQTEAFEILPSDPDQSEYFCQRALDITHKTFCSVKVFSICNRKLPCSKHCYILSLKYLVPGKFHCTSLDRLQWWRNVIPATQWDIKPRLVYVCQNLPKVLFSPCQYPKYLIVYYLVLNHC